MEDSVLDNLRGTWTISIQSSGVISGGAGTGWTGIGWTGSGYLCFQTDELATYPLAPEIEDAYLCFAFLSVHIFSKVNAPATQARPNTPKTTMSAICQLPENLQLPLVVVAVVVAVVVVVMVAAMAAVSVAIVATIFVE